MSLCVRGVLSAILTLLLAALAALVTAATWLAIGAAWAAAAVLISIAKLSEALDKGQPEARAEAVPVTPAAVVDDHGSQSNEDFPRIHRGD